MKLTLANQYLMINDKKLSYYISSTDKQPEKSIVLLHGFCGSSAYYAKLIPLLEPKYQIIAFDLPGHGNSDAWDEENYDMKAVADFLQQAISMLSLTNIHMFGHSLGGYITLAYAEQFSGQLASFGLLHSTALPDSEQAKQNLLNAISFVQKEGVKPFVEGLVGKLFGDDAKQQDMEHTYDIGLQTKPEAIIGFARGMRERADRQQVIQAAAQPVMLISGALDKIVTAEGTFSGRNETTVCHILEQAGHMGMLETPDALAKAITDFVG